MDHFAGLDVCSVKETNVCIVMTRAGSYGK